MYNGGEDGSGVEAMVVDFGNFETRIGYAGADTPDQIVSSNIVRFDDGKVRYNPTYSVNDTFDNAKLVNPFNSEDGLIDNWNDIENILSFGLSELNVVPSEHPFLFSEPSYNTKSKRAELGEIMFEKFDVPALFLSKTAVLNCFANGRSNGVVVDIGASSSTVVPVQDGFVVQKHMRKSPVGGNVLDKYLNVHMNRQMALYTNGKQKCIRAPCEFKNMVVTNPRGEEEEELTFNRGDNVANTIYVEKYDPCFLTEARLQVVRAVKETLCRVSDVKFDVAVNAQIPMLSHTLPDGTVIQMGKERFMVPEVLFVSKSTSGSDEDGDSTIDGDVDEEKAKVAASAGRSNGELDEGMEHIPDHSSLQQMVYDSIHACDPEARQNLLNNIILTGGGSCFENAGVRLERELASMLPAAMKIKIMAAQNAERQNSAWLGGSILASLGSFHEMWISKSEYSEHGTSLVHRKCP